MGVSNQTVRKECLIHGQRGCPHVQSLPASGAPHRRVEDTEPSAPAADRRRRARFGGWLSGTVSGRPACEQSPRDDRRRSVQARRHARSRPTPPCEPRRGAGERAARARKGPPSALLYMVTDKKRNTPGLGRRQSSRDTLWFRRPPPRRSRVTEMNREEKVSPTYHHRRSTGAQSCPPGGIAPGPRPSPEWSARAGFDCSGSVGCGPSG